MIFRVGMPVVGKGTQDRVEITGMTGIVKSFEGDLVLVEFNETHPSFHDGNYFGEGFTKPSHGYYVRAKRLEILHQYTKGDEEEML